MLRLNGEKKPKPVDINEVLLSELYKSGGVSIRRDTHTQFGPHAGEIRGSAQLVSSATPANADTLWCVPHTTEFVQSGQPQN